MHSSECREIFIVVKSLVVRLAALGGFIKLNECTKIVKLAIQMSAHIH